MTSRRWLVAVALVVTGCGVPVQSTPTPIEPEAIPTALRSPGPPAVTGTAVPGKPAVRVDFVRDNRLVSLFRETSTTAVADRLNTVIDALVAGPTEIEQANGITSALPAGLTVTVVAIEDKRAVLELSGEPEGQSATENILAVGQIVLSVTAVPSIDQVSFSHGGTPVEALLADGALTTAPLTANDYATLRAG